MKKPSNKIAFRFYGTAVYFLINVILVIAIVIICFIFFGKDGRDVSQQKGIINRKFQGRDHSKTLAGIIIQRVIIPLCIEIELTIVKTSRYV